MEQRVEQLLDLARRQAQQAEVYSVTSEETPVQFEANRLKSLMTRHSSGVALRVVKVGRIGFAATTRTDRLEELVDMAVELAQFGAEAKFDLPARGDYPAVEVYDPTVEHASVEAMVQLGQGLIDRIREYAPEVQCEGNVWRRVSAVRILNSRGNDVGSRKTTFGINVEGTLIRDTDMLFVGDHQSSCHPILDWTPVAEETIRQLELAQRIVEAPTGHLPVIFTPRGLGGVLLLPLSVALNGRTVLQGASPLGGRLGQQVLDRRLSVWDEPTLDYRPGSRAFDDEGVPTRRLPLVEDGVVASFVYDLQTAGLAGAHTPGSAARGLGSLPTPGLSVVRIAAGDTSFEDMVAGIEEGLVVERMLGTGQGNVLGGEFGGNVLLGYKIEHGEIVGRVKNTMVAGNVYEAFKGVLAIGREAHWVGGSFQASHIALPRVSVSARQ
ncbi:MAG: TldD/PmbA family protein [Chloroflexi bacterium]|nr:TldD/PmbA family protein [Chloroflexota bacterium]